MAALPPSFERRRPRPGSLERPVNGRLYRGTWLLVALPLLIAAFSVGRTQPLQLPTLPPAFDKTAALDRARELAHDYPDRFPGTPGAIRAAGWFRKQLAPYGLPISSDVFSATVPGRGRVRLENVSAVVQGRSLETIVLMAHRDDAGAGPGANDNASGTATLIELARIYAGPPTPGAEAVRPAHTLLFLSTDGGTLGGLGAERFARTLPNRRQIVAVLNFDALAGRRARLELAGDEPRSPPPVLLRTAAAALLDQAHEQPRRPSALGQLIDLAFPFSLYEQAPFVARGIPAVTVTTGGERPDPPVGDTPNRLDAARLGVMGRAAQELLGALDQGIELEPGPSSYVYLGSRLVRGWAIELVLIAALAPFLTAAVDLYARCRRRRISLAPALRSYRSRLGFWLWSGGLFLLLGLVGMWPGGVARPVAPDSTAAGHWPLYGLLALALLAGLGWLVARERLLPRRAVRPEEELAGATGALLVLGVVALVVVATNPFALIFVLPSLHAWLWLPQVRERAAWTRAAVLLVGFAGPLLLLGSFATRFGLGLDAPWYIAELFAVSYAPLTALLIVLAWLAGAGQLAAFAAGRYAPYPSVAERPRLGPIRATVRRAVLAARAHRRASETEDRALGDVPQDVVNG